MRAFFPQLSDSLPMSECHHFLMGWIGFNMNMVVATPGPAQPDSGEREAHGHVVVTEG